MTRHRQLVAGAEALRVVMASQHDIMRALFARAQREQEAIVSGDVAALTAVVDEQRQLMDHLDSLETDRMTALMAIATATGTDVTSATLSEIAAMLPADEAAALTRQGQELRAQAVALREAQDVNERLLERSRALVDRWLHYLRSLLSGSLYTASGDSGAMPGGRSLDKSA